MNPSKPNLPLMTNSTSPFSKNSLRFIAVKIPSSILCSVSAVGLETMQLMFLGLKTGVKEVTPLLDHEI